MFAGHNDNDDSAAVADLLLAASAAVHVTDEVLLD